VLTAGSLLLENVVLTRNAQNSFGFSVAGGLDESFLTAIQLKVGQKKHGLIFNFLKICIVDTFACVGG
jgi:hypothetical protein